MLTPEHVKWLAPRARSDYIATLTSKFAWDTMKHYGINATTERLAGFLANCMVETGYLTFKRESLKYSTAAVLRRTWPARFGAKSDEELAPLLGNERALAEATYAGRMGNRPGTTDAFDYRGWGWLQCTGYENSMKLCKVAGVDPEANPTVLDDTNVSFTVACAEWAHVRANEMIDNGRFGDACVAINAGPGALNAIRLGKKTHRQICRSLPDRLEALAKCRQLLGASPGILESFPGNEEEDEAEYEEEDAVA
jgi:predicted chitinase